MRSLELNLIFFHKDLADVPVFLFPVSPNPTLLLLLLRGYSFSLAGEAPLPRCKTVRLRRERRSHTHYETSIPLHLERLDFLLFWFLSRPSCSRTDSFLEERGSVPGA